MLIRLSNLIYIGQLQDAKVIAAFGLGNSYANFVSTFVIYGFNAAIA